MCSFCSAISRCLGVPHTQKSTLDTIWSIDLCLSGNWTWLFLNFAPPCVCVCKMRDSDKHVNKAELGYGNKSNSNVTCTFGTNSRAMSGSGYGVRQLRTLTMTATKNDGGSSDSHKQSFNSCVMMNLTELLSLSILWPSLYTIWGSHYHGLWPSFFVANISVAINICHVPSLIWFVAVIVQARGYDYSRDL